jgi:hypothetical protein
MAGTASKPASRLILVSNKENNFKDGVLTVSNTDPAKAAIALVQKRFKGGLEVDANGTWYRSMKSGEPQYVGEPSAKIDAAWDELMEGRADDACQRQTLVRE